MPTLGRSFGMQEASSKAHTAWAQPSIPSQVQQLLQDADAEVGKDSDLFWVLVAALKRFVRIYRAKADEHCEAVRSHALAIVKEARCAKVQPGDVTADAVKLFCKNARALRVARFRGVATEAQQLSAAALRQSAQDDETWNEGAIYLSLLAASAFKDRHGRRPGATAQTRDSAWEQDIKQLQHIAQGLSAELSGACTVTEELLTEVCRCAGGSMHCMGAILGGCAAQEAIKVLLRQFVPVCGVLVFDGVRGSSRVLEL